MATECHNPGIKALFLWFEHVVLITWFQFYKWELNIVDRSTSTYWFWHFIFDFFGKLFRSQRILAQLIKRINNSIQLLIALIFRLLQHDEHIKCQIYDVTYAVFILYIYIYAYICWISTYIDRTIIGAWKHVTTFTIAFWLNWCK